MNFKLLLFFIGAGLTACSSVSHTYFESSKILVEKPSVENAKIDSLVSPYKLELALEMNQVISIAANDFVNERPSGNLGNLVADIVLQHAQLKLPKDGEIIALLNFGGLRNPINKGNVTLGDLYKLMPFDNQLVYVKMPAESIFEIQAYLKKSGGEPIAGVRFIGDSIVNDAGNEWKLNDFWVVTSDYLFNGGDKMYFFQQKSRQIEEGELLRDVLIAAFKSMKILPNSTEQRIELIQN